VNDDDCADCGASSRERDPDTCACAACEHRRVAELQRDGLSGAEAAKQATAEWARVMVRARAEADRVVALYDGDEEAQAMVREHVQLVLRQDPRYMAMTEDQQDADLERMAQGMTRLQWAERQSHA
jgi:hypothetical protein